MLQRDRPKTDYYFILEQELTTGETVQIMSGPYATIHGVSGAMKNQRACSAKKVFYSPERFWNVYKPFEFE